MKILEISNNSGYYSKDGINQLPIIDLNRDDLKEIITLIIKENIEFEFTEINGVNNIVNGAEKIIYENILASFKTLLLKKTEVKQKIEAKFDSFSSKYIDD